MHLRMSILYRSVCELKSYSFDVVYQTSLPDAFPTGKILLLSYLYDGITPLIGHRQILIFRSLPSHNLQHRSAQGPHRGRSTWAMILRL